MGYAYADSQVQQLPGLGQSYFNTTQKVPKYWDGSAWQTYGSGNGTIQPTPQFRLFIQPNAGTQTIAGPSNIYTDATGNPLTVPGPITGQSTNGTVNTDMNGGIAATLSNPLCTTTGCFFERPQTTVDASTIANLFTPSLTSIHGRDDRSGSQADYYWNATSEELSGDDFRYGRSTFCGWNQVVTQILGGRQCYYDNAIFAPPGGQYVRGEPTGAQMHAENMWVYTRTIGQHYGWNDYFLSIGDKDGFRGYLKHRSASIAGSDESIEGFGLDIISLPPPMGTVTTGGAGATSLVINFTTNAGNQADGLELIDEADVMEAGNYVGTLTQGVGNAPSTFQSVDINGTPVSHAVSSGIATLTAACGATTIRNQPASATCSVTINSGSFTSGGTNFVCVADWHYYEQASITATGSGTLTLNLAYNHPAGVVIYQGAGCGGRLVLGNGSVPLSTAQVTSYAVAGAPDATHYALIVKNLGGQNGSTTLPWSQINPIIPDILTGIGPLTRSGGVVTAPLNGAPGQLYNNYAAPGSSTLTVSGTTPSDFNGVISGVTYNYQAKSLSWPQAGPNETASTNSTLELVGANNYSIYCGAETTSVTVTGVSSSITPTLNGGLQVEPNGCSWANGDAVIQPNSYAEHFASDERGMSSDASDLMPLGFPNSSRSLASLGGAEASGFVFDGLASGDPPSKFLGHGGLYTPYTYANLQGAVFNYFASMLYAPDIALFNLGCPADGCSATSAVDHLFLLTGYAGQGQFGFDTHNSTWLFNNPVSAPNSSVTGQQVGIEGTFGGIPLNNTLLTQTLGHNYSSWGSGNTGDSTASVGAGEFAAGTVMAGATIPTIGFVGPQGTAGTTSYSYVCTAVSASGGETLPTASFSTATGNATLNATNYNHVVCSGNVGDQTMNVYRSTNGGGLATGLICSAIPVNRTNEFCNDTGQAAGAAVPTTDTSGQLIVSGVTISGYPTANGQVLTVNSVGPPATATWQSPSSGIANVQIVLPTTAIAANTCTSAITTTMTGVTTTSTFTSAFATDASGVTGYGSSAGLNIVMWPTANTNNLKVCNSTASSITPGAMTLNVGAR